MSTGAGGHHYKLFIKIYRGCIAGQEKAPRYGQPASHLEEEGEATATTPQPSDRVEIVILAHSHTSQPTKQRTHPPSDLPLSYATSAAAARKFYRPLSMQPQAECGCSLCKLIDLKSFHPIRDERDRANTTPERNRTYNLVRYVLGSIATDATQPRLLLRSTLKSSMFGTEIIYFSNKLWSRRWFSGRETRRRRTTTTMMMMMVCGPE